MVNSQNHQLSHQVVIVGGGFGGLYAAKTLAKTNVNVTLIDKRNFHLFQPLLYQVATGALSPADISSPLRAVFSKSKNIKVLLGEVNDIDPQNQNVMVGDVAIPYDTLIVATGAKHSYFGKDNWEEFAPGLKTLEDALAMRRRIFMAFEAAEKETDPEKRRAWLTFVIVGAGPTGVELAGAIAELANQTLKQDFRNIDTASAKIILLEGMERILPPFAPELSQSAATSLSHLGVLVQTKTMVTNLENDVVTVQEGDVTREIRAKTILWAAGVKASSLGKVLAECTGAECDRAGRVIVAPDLSIPGYPHIFVVGDLANFSHQNGKPLPGVAPVAKQEGEYVAKLIQKQIKGHTLPAFNYSDLGSLAIIGQSTAVADFGFTKLQGFLAWLFWLLVHIYFLIPFQNKLVVLVQWVWNYLTGDRSARLITGDDSLIQMENSNSRQKYPSVPTKQALNV